ncbi:MAG TPA: ABC transporter permease [Gemmatimonadaceae bacterium]|jgi:putative ABC transport system permease protein|nr:ABC transporter permease [Gemmatimonadaceae bacterium]
MSFFQAVAMAFETIRVQKLKSFFTVIGVTIGVTFLIAVVSIVGGMTRYMQDDLVGKLFAVNSFNLRRTPDIQIGDISADERRSWRRRPQVKDLDVPAVAAALDPDVLWSIESSTNLDVESPYARPRNTQCTTVAHDWFKIKDMDVSKGRLITPEEYQLGSPVVVIGQDVADHFFPNLEPVGRQLRIQSIPYTVIGVAEKQGSVFGQSLDKFIIAPEKSPLNRWVNPHGVIDQMTVQGANDTEMRDAMETARAIMRGRHHLHPSQPDDFALETPDAALDFWNKIKGYLEIAGIALPTVGLVVGAIVIMNIMLVAVSERTREIGIRKSLGARRSDILRQFLVESATLSTFGAMIGVALGIGFAKALAAVSPLPAAVEVWSIFVGVGVGAGVGIIAGIYPASRAALLDPIAAMRQET